MVFNQQVTEEKAKETKNGVFEILDGWLPYPTDYLERREEGWHKKYKNTNKYVFLMPNYTYQKAWESCPKKQELIDYIKTLNFINVDESLKIFKEITGIDTNKPETMIEINGKKWSASTIQEALKKYIEE